MNVYINQTLFVDQHIRHPQHTAEFPFPEDLSHPVSGISGVHTAC